MTTYAATDTEFTVTSSAFPTAELALWEAMNEWCRFHDIDPHRVPLLSTIRRDVAGRRVLYTEVVVDEQGRKVFDRESMEMETREAVSQGEGPPLPFPTAQRPVVEVQQPAPVCPGHIRVQTLDYPNPCHQCPGYAPRAHLDGSPR